MHHCNRRIERVKEGICKLEDRLERKDHIHQEQSEEMVSHASSPKDSTLRRERLFRHPFHSPPISPFSLSGSYTLVIFFHLILIYILAILI